jgi:hypothetical protein
MSSVMSVLTGSVLGREHARLGRNNQDAVAVAREGEWLVAVVTDGCSSAPASEVGARLGAAFLAAHVPAIAQREASPEAVAREASAALLAYLGTIARGLAVHDDAATVVHDHLLFTFLCAVVGPSRAFVFGAGDGVFSIDGHVTVLDSGPENAPAYIAYGLLAGIAPRTSPTCVHATVDTSALRSLVIATDGVVDLLARAADPLASGEAQGDLRPFEERDAFVRNPSLVQKRLVVIGELNARLRDDTTLAVLRRAS